MTTTEQLHTGTAQNGYELAGRTRKAYRLALTIGVIAEEQGIEPLDLADSLSPAAWEAIVLEADSRFPVDTRTHTPSAETQDAVLAILTARARQVASPALREAIRKAQRA